MIRVLIYLFVASVLTGCLTSWVVILLKKIGATEWVQVHGTRMEGELAGCDYCMNWWIGWCVVIVALVVTGWWWLLAVPFFSTTIGRVLSV